MQIKLSLMPQSHLKNGINFSQFITRFYEEKDEIEVLDTNTKQIRSIKVSDILFREHLPVIDKEYYYIYKAISDEGDILYDYNSDVIT